VPRYVDTFEPEERIPLDKALDSVRASEVEFEKRRDYLMSLLKKHVH
jgi:hypothetical protein